MTRGRDTNQLLVVTDTTDLAEARDVLEDVLAHDRADIPAVTQRRELAQQLPPVTPRHAGHRSRGWRYPDWFGDWRTGLEHRRQDLIDQITDRANRQTQAQAGPGHSSAGEHCGPASATATLRHPAAAQARSGRRVADIQDRIDAIQVEEPSSQEPARGDWKPTPAPCTMLLTPLKCSTISRTTTSDSCEIFDRQLDASDSYLALAHGQPVTAANSHMPSAT